MLFASYQRPCMYITLNSRGIPLSASIPDNGLIQKANSRIFLVSDQIYPRGIHKRTSVLPAPSIIPTDPATFCSQCVLSQMSIFPCFSRLSDTLLLMVTNIPVMKSRARGVVNAEACRAGARRFIPSSFIHFNKQRNGGSTLTTLKYKCIQHISDRERNLLAI